MKLHVNAILLPMLLVNTTIHSNIFDTFKETFTKAKEKAEATLEDTWEAVTTSTKAFGENLQEHRDALLNHAKNAYDQAGHGVQFIKTVIDEQNQRIDASDVFNTFEEPDGTLRLDEAMFLGAHNAYAHPPIYNFFYQHEEDIPTQFKFGIRGFTFDVYECDKSLKLAHGGCSGNTALALTGSQNPDFLDLKNTLQQFNTLLDNAPKSIIILYIKEHNTSMGATINTVKKIPDLQEKTLFFDDWSLEKNNGQWPTLQWMRDNNKRCIIFNNRPIGGSWRLWPDVKENTFNHKIKNDPKLFDHRDESARVTRERSLYFFNYTNFITTDFATSKECYSNPTAANTLEKAKSSGVKDTPNVVFIDRSEAIMEMKINGQNDTLIDNINKHNREKANIKQK